MEGDAPDEGVADLVDETDQLPGGREVAEEGDGVPLDVVRPFEPREAALEDRPLAQCELPVPVVLPLQEVSPAAGAASSSFLRACWRFSCPGVLPSGSQIGLQDIKSVHAELRRINNNAGKSGSFIGGSSIKSLIQRENISKGERRFIYSPRLPAPASSAPRAPRRRACRWSASPSCRTPR